MKPFVMVSATGMLGSGFREESIERAIQSGAQLIACDAGSTDAGPHSLASGVPQFSRAALWRDTEILLRRARDAGVPLVLGSCGTAGANANVDYMRDLVIQIASEASQRFRLAIIRSEISTSKLEDLRSSGRTRPLLPATELTPDDVAQSRHTVAMMGVEPLQRALSNGANVILAGRSSDAALYAAAPLMEGYPAAAAWHAGKILECGAAAVKIRLAPDSMLGIVNVDGSFEVEPLRDDYACTPQSVASHTLYENADPFELVEPSGVLSTADCRYEAVTDRRVRVTGSRFSPRDEYSVKLEGVKLGGYSTIVLGAIRDPLILGQIDQWLELLRTSLEVRLRQAFGSADFSITTRVYGRDGVMGETEPIKRVEGHEIAILWDVLSGDQELSHSVASSLSHMAVHNPIPEWHGLISGVAFPFAPAEVDRGPVYEFHLQHVALPESPTELFEEEIVEVRN